MDSGYAFTGTTVAGPVFEALRARPGCCAIRYLDLTISNGLLLHKVHRLSGILQREDIPHHARVGVCIERGPEVLVILLALWSLGAVYVPLDPALPRERLLVISAEAELDFLITQTHLDELLSAMLIPALVLTPVDFVESMPCYKPSAEAVGEAVAEIVGETVGETVGATVGETVAEVIGETAGEKVGEIIGETAGEKVGKMVREPVQPEDPAYILFTSGSSGIPKGVMISHGNLAVLMQAILPLLRLPEAACVLACASFSFDVSLFELLTPLLAGGSVVLAGQEACRNPELLAELIRDQKVNVVQATPTLWQLLNRGNWQPAVNDFVAISTGEALPRSIAQDILARTPVLWNLYGPTECTIWASAHRVQLADISNDAPALVSIGKALPGYRLRLDIREGQTIGDSAELIIEGAGVGHGYCTQPTMTARVFSTITDCIPASRCYLSGDLCRFDANGALHFCGRRDNQVKHNGYRIELDEIASLLQLHPSIRQAVCLLRKPAQGRTSLLFACVVPASGMPNKNRQTLNRYLARSLPEWMLPLRYYFLDSMPLTTNGKVDRAALMMLTRPPPGVSRCDDSLQHQVAGIFCELLEIDTIGPCDSFFDAGGSSMLGATLVMMLNERFATRISMHQALLSPPTVLRITRLLEAVLQSGQAAER